MRAFAVIAVIVGSLQIVMLGRADAAGRSLSKTDLIRTVSQQCDIYRPAHEKDATDSRPLDAIEQAAYPSAENLVKILKSQSSIDRDDALLLARMTEDLVSVNPDNYGGILSADFFRRPEMQSFLRECVPTASARDFVVNQNVLANAGVKPLTMPELCEFATIIRAFDHSARHGNG